MTIDLTDVLRAIITLLVSIITVFVIPILKEKWGENKLQEISKWVAIAVQAAEQIFDGPGRGEQKKQYVIDFLNSKGFSIDTDEINNLIESAVYNLIL